MTNKNLEDTFNDLSEAIMTDSENESFVGVQDEANIDEQGVNVEEPSHVVPAGEADVIAFLAEQSIDHLLRLDLEACQKNLAVLNRQLEDLRYQISDGNTELRKLERLVAVLDRIDKTGEDE